MSFSDVPIPTPPLESLVAQVASNPNNAFSPSFHHGSARFPRPRGDSSSSNEVAPSPPIVLGTKSSPKKKKSSKDKSNVNVVENLPLKMDIDSSLMSVGQPTPVLGEKGVPRPSGVPMEISRVPNPALYPGSPPMR